MSTARRRVKRLALAAALATPVAWACGPFFPERVLLNRSATMLTAPPARFADEIAALKVPPPALTPNWAVSEHHEAQTIEVDLAELRSALAGRPDAAAVAGRYAAVRAKLRDRRTRPAAGPRPKLAVPAGLPAEFADYLAGAIAWADYDYVAAQKAWERLLSRPPAERRRRSTWAAFMLGRLHHGTDAARARLSYRQTRQLASQGFDDGLGLGAASLGYEALTELDEGHFGRAAQLYLEAGALNDPSAVASLRALARRLLDAGEGARAAALKEASVRRVLVSYLAASDLSAAAKDSIEARAVALLLEQTRGERDVEGADRLAWISYQRGDVASADEWLRRAPGGSPVAAWIRSKMLARQGKIDEAARSLAGAVDAFPLDPGGVVALEIEGEPKNFDPSRRLRGELSVLKLARGQFVDALELLVSAGYWRDAAQVAERALTLDELRTHVDARWPETPPPPPGAEPRPDDDAKRLRYLLARRLARAGRWGDARPYYPPDLRTNVDEYRKAQALARDVKQSAEARAEALWAVAKIERTLGMELLGTEVGPDWHVDGGQFDEDARVGAPFRERLSLVGRAERRRAQKAAPTPEKRFHYRFVAARHALEASRLLPEGSPQIHEMLCTAHKWLVNRDPRAARPYAAEARRRHTPCP